MKFRDYELNETLQTAIEKLGFTAPTEIQQKSIPVLLQGRDLIGQSKTGSGKTAAYLLPILNRIMQSNGMAMVLVPTRELALQVEEFAKKLIPRSQPGQSHYKIATVIGGASLGYQVRALSQSPNLIIGTPGRIMDHIGRNTIKFDRLETMILDEADRMLDMGFLPQIKKILPRLPRERQTILFSATFSGEVRTLASQMMKNPATVSVGEANAAPVAIEQQVIETVQAKKNNLMVDELNKRQGSILIFCRTKNRTDRLHQYLGEYGFKVGRLHGDRTLAQRRQAVEAFKTGLVRILVATDVAARGLDIPQVGHVVNFDLPMTPEDYLHRIGRTGRAGASGQAVTFVIPEEMSDWNQISRMYNRSKGATDNRILPWQNKPGIRRVQAGQSERPARGGGGGRRGERAPIDYAKKRPFGKPLRKSHGAPIGARPARGSGPARPSRYSDASESGYGAHSVHSGEGRPSRGGPSRGAPARRGAHGGGGRPARAGGRPTRSGGKPGRSSSFGR